MANQGEVTLHLVIAGFLAGVAIPLLIDAWVHGTLHTAAFLAARLAVLQ